MLKAKCSPGAAQSVEWGTLAPAVCTSRNKVWEGMHLQLLSHMSPKPEPLSPVSKARDEHWEVGSRVLRTFSKLAQGLSGFWIEEVWMCMLSLLAFFAFGVAKDFGRVFVFGISDGLSQDLVG